MMHTRVAEWIALRLTIMFAIAGMLAIGVAVAPLGGCIEAPAQTVQKRSDARLPKGPQETMQYVQYWIEHESPCSSHVIWLTPERDLLLTVSSGCEAEIVHAYRLVGEFYDFEGEPIVIAYEAHSETWLRLRPKQY